MENELVIATGINLPPILWKGKVVIENPKGLPRSSQKNIITAQSPVTFKADGLEPFTFPYEPLISMSFRNVITRRSVAKGEKRGTIKEHWSEDDVEISISGIFISSTGEYPEEVDRLRAFFEKRTAIIIECPLVNNRNIHFIAIEGFDLPPTKGMENQAFSIKAYSDDVFNLLIEE